MGISRRTILKLAGLTPLAKISGLSIAQAQDRQFRHALTLFDDIKYRAGFQEFRLCEPGGAEGRQVAAFRRGIIRQFQPLHLQGRPWPGR